MSDGFSGGNKDADPSDLPGPIPSGIAGALGELMSMSKAEINKLGKRRRRRETLAETLASMTVDEIMAVRRSADPGVDPRAEFVRSGDVTRVWYVPDWETASAHATEKAAREPFVDHPGAGLPPGPEPHEHGPMFDFRMADRMARWLAARGIPPVGILHELMRSGYGAEDALLDLIDRGEAIAPDLFDALDQYQRWVKSIVMVAERHLARLGLAP